MASQPTYEALAEALAIHVYSRCEEWPVGTVIYQHFAENNLNVPCEILARVGVMQPLPRDTAHAFRNNWAPGKPLTISRNEGEAPYDHLVLALVEIVRWFRPTKGGHSEWTRVGTDRLPTSVDMTPGPINQGQIALLAYANRRVAGILEELGYGRWNNDTEFELTELGDRVPDISTYWTDRA